MGLCLDWQHLKKCQPEAEAYYRYPDSRVHYDKVMYQAIFEHTCNLFQTFMITAAAAASWPLPFQLVGDL